MIHETTAMRRRQAEQPGQQRRRHQPLLVPGHYSYLVPRHLSRALMEEAQDRRFTGHHGCYQLLRAGERGRPASPLISSVVPCVWRTAAQGLLRAIIPTTIIGHALLPVSQLATSASLEHQLLDGQGGGGGAALHLQRGVSPSVPPVVDLSGWPCPPSPALSAFWAELLRMPSRE